MGTGLFVWFVGMPVCTALPCLFPATDFEMKMKDEGPQSPLRGESKIGDWDLTICPEGLTHCIISP